MGSWPGPALRPGTGPVSPAGRYGRQDVGVVFQPREEIDRLAEFVIGLAHLALRVAQLRGGGAGLGCGDERGGCLARFADHVDRVAAQFDLIGKAGDVGQLQPVGVGLVDRGAGAALCLEGDVERDRVLHRDFLAPIGIAPGADQRFAPAGDRRHLGPAAGQLAGNPRERGIDGERGPVLRHAARPPARIGEAAIGPAPRERWSRFATLAPERSTARRCGETRAPASRPAPCWTTRDRGRPPRGKEHPPVRTRPAQSFRRAGMRRDRPGRYPAGEGSAKCRWRLRP